MIPIHELLNRIRWDRAFSEGEFSIGYYDRLKAEIIIIPLDKAIFDKEDHFNFSFVDETGEVHTIPLHRIKQVYKNGELIWHREH